MADLYETLQKLYAAGASRSMVEEMQSAYKQTNPAMPERTERGFGEKLMGGVTSALSNLDRPRGAVTAALGGNNPLQGFMNPDEYHMYKPTDNAFKRVAGGIMEAGLDPLNFVGAKYLSHLPEATPFARKLLAETAVNVGARGAADLTQYGLQAAGAPEWAQQAGGLAGGLAGGISAGMGTRGMGTRPNYDQTALPAQPFADPMYGPEAPQKPNLDSFVRADNPGTASWVSQRGEFITSNNPDAFRPAVQAHAMHASTVADAYGMSSNPMTDDDMYAQIPRFMKETGALRVSPGFSTDYAMVEFANPPSQAQWQAIRKLAQFKPRLTLSGPDNIVRDFDTTDKLWLNNARRAFGEANMAPNAFLAQFALDRTAITNPTGLVQAQKDAANVAGLDAISDDIKKGAFISGGANTTPTLANADALKEASESLWSTYKGLQDITSYNAVDIMSQQMKALPDKVKHTLGPTWAWRILDGQTNRNPLAAQAARVGYNYANSQKAAIGTAMKVVDDFVKTELGPMGGKVQMANNASTEVKRAFQLAQASGHQNAAIGVIVEHPEMFSLTSTQKAFLEDLKMTFDADTSLSKRMGVDVSGMFKSWRQVVKEATDAGDMVTAERYKELAKGGGRSNIPFVENYSRHMVELLDPEGNPLKQDMWPRFLGSERSFQKHRLFDSWTDIMLSSADQKEFQSRITRAMNAAMADGDMDEANRLRDLMQGGIGVGIRRGTFAESVAERLSMSAKQRSEQLAINAVKLGGGDVLAEQELKSLLNADRISDALRIPAMGAGALRSLQLRADVSLFGVQSWGAFVMGKGLKGGMDISTGDFFKTIGTDDGFAKWSAANSKRLSRWQLSDLELNQTILEIPDDLDILKRVPTIPGSKKRIEGNLTTQGKAVPGLSHAEDAINYLDKVQFGRMATIWKVETADHLYGLMRAARDGHLGFSEMLQHPALGMGSLLGQWKNLDDEALMRSASAFTNNLYGGLNRVAQGRSAVQNLVESIFVLTPGFTRGTVSIGLQAGNLLKWSPEAALSRDFAIRGLLLAGTVIAGVSAAVNGITDDGTVAKVNLTDPSESDWMTIPLPGGRSISPLSRWRGTGRMVGEAAITMLEAGPKEAAMMFGGDTLQWATYRQSALATSLLGDPVGDFGRAHLDQQNIGNRYAAGQGLLNILLDPEEDRKGQIAKAAVSNVAPVAIGKVVEENFLGPKMEPGRGLTGTALYDTMFTFVGEMLGQGTQAPNKLERAVGQYNADQALQRGVPKEVVADALNRGRNPLYATDAEGRYFLSPDDRRAGVEKTASELGLMKDGELDTELVRNSGQMSMARRRSEVQAVDDAQTDQFFTGMDIANERYADAMKSAEQALKNGVPPKDVSKFISEARAKRAEAKDVVEAANPLALGFLQSPERLAKENDRTQLFKAISAEAYSEDFFDPDTLSFNFEEQDRLYSHLRQKYGKNFDAWQDWSERNKTPLEKQRDDAFDRLGTYFAIGDEIWQRTTGGQLGSSERDFDRMMRDELQASGIQDVGVQNFMLTQMKSEIVPIKVAKSLTSDVRDMMRASDPVMESDVVNWLGSTPIQLKDLSKRDRALVNQLLAGGD
jgi:hypothetical protein